MTTVLSQKGQIVIPGAIREEMNLEPGDDFEILTNEDGDSITLRRITKRPNEGLLELLQSCPYPLDLPERDQEPSREIVIEE